MSVNCESSLCAPLFLMMIDSQKHLYMAEELLVSGNGNIVNFSGLIHLRQKSGKQYIKR